MERDSSVGGGDIVVGLAEHGVEAVQGHVLGQQAVSQSVDLQQPLQLLSQMQKTGRNFGASGGTKEEGERSYSQP